MKKSSVKQCVKNATIVIATILTLSLANPPALAQPNDPKIQVLKIPSGSLGDSLVAISNAFDANVLASEDIVEGKKARAVSGTMGVEEAISRVLAGTGLTFRLASNGSYVITETTRSTGARSVRENALVPENVDEVIVLGTKQNLSIQDTLTSAAVVTENDIRERALFNVEDIILRTPNVSSQGNGTLSSLSIRGISFPGVGNTGQGQTSQVYVDKAPAAPRSGQGAFNLWDVEQVEILRGPQSTAQGRNALAGAVIVTSADPEYEFGSKFRGLIGNEEQSQISAMVTGPILDDQLAFRIAADYREIDFGVFNPILERNTRFEEATTLRGKLLFEPEAINGLRIELIANYEDTDIGALNSVSPPNPGDPRAASFDPFGDVSFGSADRRIATEVQRYIVDTSYDVSEHWSLIATGTYEDVDGEVSLNPAINGSSDTRTYSAEFRAQFEYERVSGWLGGYYFDQTGRIDTVFESQLSQFGIPTIPADSVVASTGIEEADIENTALFADFTYRATERLTFNIGARYDREELTDDFNSTTISIPDSCIIAPTSPAAPGFPCVLFFPGTTDPTRNATFEAFLPRGSLKYDIDDLRSVGLLLARGYRAGGSYLFASPSNPGVTEIREYDPEYMTSYELTFRSQWPSLAELVLNANVFFMDWDDQQVTVPGPSRATLDRDILNAGSSEVYGIEI